MQGPINYHHFHKSGKWRVQKLIGICIVNLKFGGTEIQNCPVRETLGIMWVTQAG